MAEPKYTWLDPGEKNFVNFTDCNNSNLFEDLDWDLEPDISESIVNVPARVLESIEDVEDWTENFVKTMDKKGERRTRNRNLPRRTAKQVNLESDTRLTSTSVEGFPERDFMSSLQEENLCDGSKGSK